LTVGLPYIDPRSFFPGPTNYQIEVVTSDCRGAGTDSDISIVIYGKLHLVETGCALNEIDQSLFEQLKQYHAGIKMWHIGQCFGLG
jgi:hypothetical protein